MITRLFSAALAGIDGFEVQVEVDARQVMDAARFSVVGLPDAAVRESVQRVASALSNSSFFRPADLLVTVNLAPADVKKQGPGFDLPMAIGLEMAIQSNYEAVPEPLRRALPGRLEDWCLVGELALDGRLRGVRGVLSLAVAAREAGRRFLMVAQEDAPQAALVQGLTVYGVRDLREAWEVLLDPRRFEAAVPAPVDALDAGGLDFADVKGQAFARRAMEIAAAGGHHLLMCGSPGSGKSMLAARLPSILPPLSMEESLLCSRIYSVCGVRSGGEGLMRVRPFRSPHHTISDVGLMGGGAHITPGEITLAHHGVLFLDELPEFSRRTLETLRQPLECGRVTISRASGSVDFPCAFMLVAAMNPCPCGYLGDPRRACRCSPADVARYRRKISGPLIDRFDLLIDVPPVDPARLVSLPEGEPSAVIRRRVEEARARQSRRYAGLGVGCNARLGGRALQQFCPLTERQRGMLLSAVQELALSARAYDRVLRVARTIADLAGRECLVDADLYEAIQFRQFENQLRA